jgi:hypothetical protein
MWNIIHCSWENKREKYRLRPVRERICVLRMKGKFHNYPLICAHTQTEAEECYEKDYVHDNLEEVLEELPKFDIKMCLGNHKAKVGAEDCRT